MSAVIWLLPKALKLFAREWRDERPAMIVTMRPAWELIYLHPNRKRRFP
jgi:hypothetical protein